jgi:hypothetical protein
MHRDNKITLTIIFILCYANRTPISKVASEIGLKINMRKPRRLKLLVKYNLMLRIFTRFVTAFGPLSNIKEWIWMILLGRRGGGFEGVDWKQFSCGLSWAEPGLWSDGGGWNSDQFPRDWPSAWNVFHRGIEEKRVARQRLARLCLRTRNVAGILPVAYWWVSGSYGSEYEVYIWWEITSQRLYFFTAVNI